MFLAAKNRCLPVGRQSIPLVWIFDHYSFYLKSQTNGNTEENIQQTGRPPCPEQVPAAGIPPYRPLQHGAASPAQGFGPAIGSEARRGRAAAHCLWVSEGAGKERTPSGIRPAERIVRQPEPADPAGTRQRHRTAGETDCTGTAGSPAALKIFAR